MSVLLQIHATGFLTVMIAYFLGTVGEAITSMSSKPGPVARALAHMYLWLLPFVWVVDLSFAFRCIGQGDVIPAGIFIALAWGHYRQWKKSGDDRGKKVRRKISAKVALNSDGRVAVVPT